jgi:hypothetical protein
MIGRTPLVAAVIAATLLSFAASASAMTWSKPAHFAAAGISRKTSFPPSGISCPSSRLCAVSVSPIPPGRAYQGPSWIATTRNPGAKHPVWTATQVRPFHPLEGITCARSGVCTTYDLQFFYISTDAFAARPRWRRLSLPSVFTSLSCPSARLCVASGERGGMVAVSTNPTGRRPHWRKLRVSTATAPCPGSDCPTPISATGVATCPTTSSCTAIDDAGNRFTTSKPTGGARGWRVAGRYRRSPAAPGTFPDLGLACTSANCPGLDCPSTGLCTGVSVSGQNFFTETDPHAAWRTRRLPAAPVSPVPNSQPTMLSCASKGFCAVLDWGGYVFTSHHPLSASPRWSTRHLQFAEEQAASIACPSASLCVAVAPGAKLAGQQISIGRG